MRKGRGRVWSLFWLSLGLTVVLAACGGRGRAEVEITVASFSVTRAAHEAIIPKFQEKWQREHQQRVHFRQSYGGSGAQTRAIIDGLRADVAHLALALDMDRLVAAGLVAPDWAQRFPNQSVVSQSVAAIVVREGNPKRIQTWEDLGRPDVQLITADPKTSGIARWNFLALWHAAMDAGADTARATEFLTRVFRNVPVLAKDAREAMDVFAKQGRADALLNYENEVLLALDKGKPLTYVVPSVNVAIANPIAIVDRNVDKHGNREVVEAFVRFLFSPEAQVEFAKAGFRPVGVTVPQALADRFPPIAHLGTVEDYGGWGAVQRRFLDEGALFDRIQARLQSEK